VYVQEIKNAERKAQRRAKMEERYGAVLEGASEPLTTEPERG
jgi:hypothetical protein